MGYLVSWLEVYCFNFWEVVLEVGLVKNVIQIVLIEDAIVIGLLEFILVEKDMNNFIILGYRRGVILIVNVGVIMIEFILMSLLESG